MTALALQMFESPGGKMLLNLHNAEVCEAKDGEHGYLSMECFVPMSLSVAFHYYDQAPGKWLTLNFGAGSVWEGRVEDRVIVTGGLRLTAFGAWRALADVPYTALWSDSGLQGWQPLNQNDISSSVPDKHAVDLKERLYIAPEKNGQFSSSIAMVIGYQIPDDSLRQIVGVQFDFKLRVPNSTWNANCLPRNADWSWPGGIPWSLNGTGSVQSGSANVTFTGAPGLSFRLAYNSGTPVTYAGETGDYYLEITNLRVVTSTASRVNTTTTTTISAGSQVVTPASMANIYVGQRLFINQSATTSESVEVTAVTATTFTATFVNGYSGTTTIHAHVIHADEIIKDLLSRVVADNPQQLSSSVALIESPGVDLLNEVYEDEFPADIAIKLAGLGDNQSPPRRWEVGVWDDQVVHFRPQRSAAREWYVDADDLEVDSTMETLVNSAYGVYQDAGGRALRTANGDDAASQARYGIVRREAVRVNTTSATQAGIYRDTVIADGAIIKPRSVLLPDYVMDQAGAPYPKRVVQAGDTLVIRNLPPTISQDVERISTFRVKERAFDWINGRITVVPEEPPPSLDLLVARQSEGLSY